MKIKLITQKMRLVLVLAFIFGYCVQSNAQWKTVRTGGGGQVTSILAHPKVQGLYFITTDVGTPYRWNSETQAWEGLFFNLPTTYWTRNAAGNIAFDPNDATGNVLYATIGPKPTGGLLKSTDRGLTWIDCQLPLNVMPSSDQRYGQRLAVDPNNSNVVYVTTRPSTTGVTSINGTFKSIDAGSTWTKINDLCGAFLTFDVSGGISSGVTKNIFIGCADGVYLSTNGGTDFTLMAGSPTNPVRADIHSNGTMYVTHFKSVSKWNGTVWTDITPSAGFTYIPVAVNPQNSNHVIAGLANSSPYKFEHYLSDNGGTTWKKITPVADISEVPWFASTISQGLKGLCWDPFDQNMVWFTDFFQPFQTTNIWAGTNVTWKARAVGEEETVSEGNLLCPPSGVNLLLSNAADLGGFDHTSLTSPPALSMQGANQFPYNAAGGGWGNMTGVAVQETNPNFIARVGRAGWSGSGYAGYSTDGGVNYTKWVCPAGAAGGRIAVSANSETMVWATQNGSCYRSVDRGANWTLIATLPSSVIVGAQVFNSGPVFPLAADKVNGLKFYVYNTGKMYVSTDGGIGFAMTVSNLPNPWNTNPLAVETNPSKEGDVWIAMNDYGLYHSTNSGTSFSAVANVQIANSISFGKSSPSSPTVPAIYVYGTVNNIPDGLFRSNDNGATWTTISAPIKTGGPVFGMSADRQVYGRVFFATTGNGIFYISDMIDTQPPTTPTSLVSVLTTSTSLRFTWSSSIDNVSVAGYDIYQDGVLKGNSVLTSYTLTGLTAGTTYAITVKAKDPTGNVSAASTTLNVTTPLVYIPAVNIALNKPITGNGTVSSLPWVNDGDLTTGWGASGGLPYWFNIDLGDLYNISGAEMYWTHTDWIYNYRIEVSKDNSVWVMASDKTNNTYSGPPSEINNFTSIGYRYIKLTITGWGTTGYSGSTAEFKVFGTLAATGTKNLPTSNVNIYPNPATEYLGIENLKLNADVTITTLNGITVYNKRVINDNRLTLSVNNWAKGVYLIRVKDDTGMSTMKVIIQ